MIDGNLGQHLRVLAEVGYAEVTREQHGRRGQSLYATTPLGRAAFAGHIAALEAIMVAAKGEQPRVASPSAHGDSPRLERTDGTTM